jgi:hypothetical protein
MPGRLTDRLRAAAYRFRLRKKFADAPTQRVHHISNPWHSVSIVSSYVARSCPAVQKLTDQRFLSHEAPRLPLPECTMQAHCKCRFRHHTDRRSESRRARDSGLPDGNYYGPERRNPSRGRRVTDL